MDSIEKAIDHLQKGGMIIVVDDEGRENEGDLICSASSITPEQINFMARYGRGLICLALSSDQVEKLKLPMMVYDKSSGDSYSTAFTFSIDAKRGISTGISAADRALTIRRAIDITSTLEDLVIPGHIFPLKAKTGGVLERRGHTESAVTLMKLAGLPPGGVICEILRDDGEMMRLPELKTFAHENQLPIISIESLVQYVLDRQVNPKCQASLPTPWGKFEQRIYHDPNTQEHILLWTGDLAKIHSPLVRIHSECLTGDIFASERCDCGAQLKYALDLINQEGAGILIYLRQEGRGIGLTEKIKSYHLQDQGLDTVEANHALGYPSDLRTYEVALKMLKDLEINKVRLLTNNPDKVAYLERHLIHVERIPLVINCTRSNRRYQQTKKEKFGHYIAQSCFDEVHHVS